MTLDSMNSLLVLNSNVAIIPAGKELTGEGGKIVVSSAYNPDLPAADNDDIAAPWERFGRITRMEPGADDSTTNVELCADNGQWDEETVETSVNPRFNLTMADVGNRAFELTFGLPQGALDSTEGGRPWSTGRRSIDCWLYIRHNDHRQQGKRLLHGRIFGTLRLTTAPQTSREVANAVYEFKPKVSVEGNLILPLA